MYTFRIWWLVSSQPQTHKNWAKWLTRTVGPALLRIVNKGRFIHHHVLRSFCITLCKTSQIASSRRSSVLYQPASPHRTHRPRKLIFVIGGKWLYVKPGPEHYSIINTGILYSKAALQYDNSSPTIGGSPRRAVKHIPLSRHCTRTNNSLTLLKSSCKFTGLQAFKLRVLAQFFVSVKKAKDDNDYQIDG